MLDLGTDLLCTVQDYRHCLSFTSKGKEARNYVICPWLEIELRVHQPLPLEQRREH